MEVTYPQQGVLIGDAVQAPYDANEFALNFIGSLLGFARRDNYGVIKGYDNGTHHSLEVTPTTVASANVVLRVGAATVRGTIYANTSDLTLAVVANASGNPRIDTLILRKDYALQTVRAVVLQGSPAATPAPPILTQIDNNVWEIPLADIAVANGFSTITASNITPRHEWVNVGDGTYIDGLLNNSGITLEDGDVVIWDYTTARSVTTTTQANNWRVAGVWRGRTANGERGRIQTKGFGKVKLQITNALPSSRNVAVGTMLATGYVAGKATHINVGTNPAAVGLRGTDSTTVSAARTGYAPAQIGTLMEALTVGASGTFDDFVLAYIDVQKHLNPHTTTLKYKVGADAGTFNAGSYIARSFNTISHGEIEGGSIGAANNSNNYVSTNGSQITLQPGIYKIRGFATAYRVDSHLAGLWDVAAGALVVSGSAAYSPSASDSSQTVSEFNVILNLSAPTTYEVRHRCQTTRIGDGLGKHPAFVPGQLVDLVYLEINRINEIYATG